MAIQNIKKEVIENFILNNFHLVDDMVFNNEGFLVKFGKNKQGYLQKNLPIAEKTYVKLGKHRIVYCLANGVLSEDLEIDHIDCDKLNNHPSNLRLVSRSHNMANIKKTDKPCSTQYKGVTFDKCNNSYKAYIRVNNKNKTIGYFHNIDSAARAYDDMARKVFGIYARTNF
jgi:hypothetical protein